MVLKKGDSELLMKLIRDLHANPLLVQDLLPRLYEVLIPSDITRVEYRANKDGFEWAANDLIMFYQIRANDLNPMISALRAAKCEELADKLTPVSVSLSRTIELPSRELEFHTAIEEEAVPNWGSLRLENVLDAVQNSTIIGRGNYGTVYHYQLNNGHGMAIKCISLDDGLTEAEGKMEYELLRKAESDHIVTVYGVQSSPDSLYITMEFMRGGSLHKHINKALSQAETIWLSYQLLKAVNHIHSLGIIHRDIKPLNIFLNEEKTVAKLGDFGSGRQLRTNRTHVTTKASGTCRYMAPETLDDTGKQGPMVDMWSVGATMVHMKTGHVPFFDRMKDDFQVVFKVGSGAMTYDKREDNLDCFIGKLMTIQGSDRPTAQQALTELKDLKSDA